MVCCLVGQFFILCDGLVAFSRNMGETAFLRYWSGEDEADLQVAIYWLTLANEQAARTNRDIGLHLALANLLADRSEEAAKIIAQVGDQVNELPLPPIWSWHSPSFRKRVAQIGIQAAQGYWWATPLLEQKPAEFIVMEAIQSTSLKQYDVSLDRYRRAIALSPSVWTDNILLGYYQTLAHSHSLSERRVADRVMSWLSRVAPRSEDDPYPASVLTSSVLAVQSGFALDCWTLQSYRYDEQALAQGPWVPMSFTWRRSTSVPPGEAEAAILVQDHLASNLVPNGGFEWETSLIGHLPAGWERSIYHEDRPEDRLVIYTQRDGIDTQVAKLNPPPSASASSSLTTLAIPVAPSHSYLLSALIRSDPGGRSFLGYAWRSPDLTYIGTHSYVAGGIKVTTWNVYASVIHPPPGATYVEVWLHIQSGQGPGFFDNVLLVELQTPACH